MLMESRAERHGPDLANCQLGGHKHQRDCSDLEPSTQCMFRQRRAYGYLHSLSLYLFKEWACQRLTTLRSRQILIPHVHTPSTAALLVI